MAHRPLMGLGEKQLELTAKALCELRDQLLEESNKRPAGMWNFMCTRCAIDLDHLAHLAPGEHGFAKTNWVAVMLSQPPEKPGTDSALVEAK